MDSASIVITGVGLVTPCGPDRESSWRGLCAGQSCCRWLDAPAAWAGAPAPLPPPPAGVPRARQLAARALDEAWRDARLDDAAQPRTRIGLVLGVSKPALDLWPEPVPGEEWAPTTAAISSGVRDSSGAARQRGASRRASRVTSRPAAAAWDVEAAWPSGVAAALAAERDLGGPVLCPVAACATGLVSLQRGAALLADDQCDVVLAGAADASLWPILLASYQRLGVLARGFDDPATAVRPFDAARSGFLVGEGSAVLVLERAESAAARGVRTYATWLGGGLVSDPTPFPRLDPRAESLTWLIGDLLRRTRTPPADLDYLNLHGTGTLDNDRAEVRGVRQALGPAADRVAASGLKGTCGHLLGAAGAVELAAAVLALRDGVVPPTANLTDPDPACPLDLTPLRPRRAPLTTALKLSLGFGGHLAAALLRRGDRPPLNYGVAAAFNTPRSSSG